MIIGAIFGGLLSALWTLDTVRLRGRAGKLVRLPASDAPVSERYVFLHRAGVVLPEATKRAASAYAESQSLEVLDLVPASLPTWRVAQLLSAFDPKSYRGDRLAAGATAGDALLVDRDLLARVKESSEYPGDPTDVVSIAELARVLKRYASQSSDVAVTEAFEAPTVTFRDRRRLLHHQFGELVVVVQALIYFWLAATWLLAPLWGAIATAILHLQMFATTVGTALRPRDRFVSLFFRSVIDVVAALGVTPLTHPEAHARARKDYQRLLAGGTDHFFEPMRANCPICASVKVSTVLEVGDRYQLKPGRFKISECADCGYRFQNPRLSSAGLEFYYRDFYDGLGKERLEWIFAFDAKLYLDRARMVSSVTTPDRWLDVGAGHGHFCNMARDVLPSTAFDGLDMTESIEDAERRRWIQRGFRGIFPVVATDIVAKGDLYDVVSMSHYLEHTIDPRGEIAAAKKVLRDGGLLMIEVPDPESAFGRLLGRHWMPWFQPQHLSFLSVKNLERLLVEHGFSVVATHRGEAHRPTEFTFVTSIAIENLAPALNLPWRAPSGPLAAAWRRLVWFAFLPALIGAIVLDRCIEPLARRPGWSNAYRVLAKKSETA